MREAFCVNTVWKSNTSVKEPTERDDYAEVERNNFRTLNFTGYQQLPLAHRCSIHRGGRCMHVFFFTCMCKRLLYISVCTYVVTENQRLSVVKVSFQRCNVNVCIFGWKTQSSTQFNTLNWLMGTFDKSTSCCKYSGQIILISSH